MKKIILLLCLFLPIVGTAQNAKPFVVPELKKWQGANGEFVASGNIVVKHKSMRNVAGLFAEDYKKMFGKTLQIKTGKPKAGDFVFELQKNLPEEAYAIDISNIVRVKATYQKGAYWATRTLLQLSEQKQTQALPCGSIEDEPSYPVRGFMLDCGRKFIPMNYLQKLVKVMAYYKMNTLQVHLNDNGFRQYFENDWMKTQAAFRLESTTFPGLTAKDGSYTKREFSQFQKDAASVFVDIIPEIDVPAHCLAFTQYKPEIGSKEYGMDHLDLDNPETYKFVDALFTEYLEGAEPVFSGKYVNIGTDEYSNRDQRIVEKFRAFTDRYLRLVKRYGKTPSLWGALTHAKGKTPVMSDDVVMNVWSTDYSNPQEMKNLGYKLIIMNDGEVYIVPGAGYYYDYLNCEHLYNNWTPSTFQSGKFAPDDKQILGGMFAVWNDHVGNGISVSDIHHRLFPAMQTLSSKLWRGRDTALPYSDFDKKRMDLSEAPGINELGTLRDTLIINDLKPNALLSINGCEQIGYDYTVTLQASCKEEKPGTVLLSSDASTFYLSTPWDGKLGFERDGYRYSFSRAFPTEGEHTLKIEGNNQTTRLYIDGKLTDDLKPQKVYPIFPKNRLKINADSTKQAFLPTVYDTRGYYPMTFFSTLVFPLKNCGDFQSKIHTLKAWQNKK